MRALDGEEDAVVKDEAAGEDRNTDDGGGLDRAISGGGRVEDEDIVVVDHSEHGRQ